MSGFALAAKARLAGYRLQSFESVGSTNAEARAAAVAGDPGGIWFVAREQTAGKGRRGRPWSTAYGNLAATLLIVPEANRALAATLGFAAGIALNRALGALLPGAVLRSGIDGADAPGGARIALKWPNDVLADGAKVAGILLEAVSLADRGQAVAIGFGVNVATAPSGLPYPAVSLADLGADADAATVFDALSDAWVDCFSLWADGAGVGGVLAEWRQAAAGIGAPVAVTQGGVVVRGVFEAVDDVGRLIVRADNNAVVAITAGDVHFGATAGAR